MGMAAVLPPGHASSTDVVDAEYYIAFDDDYAMVKTRAPSAAIGKPLSETALRRKFGVTVVGIKRPGEDFTYATQDTVLERGDVLIVSGRTRHVERFADLT